MTRATTWLSALAVAAVAGCASAPPFVAPAVPLPERLTATPLPAATAGGVDGAERAQSLVANRLACGAWWHGFGDARIDAHVARALAGNPTIEVAQASLRQAHALALAQAATLWPSADLGVAALRTHGANASLVNNSAPGARTALVSASYSPDLFGAMARTAESSKALEEVADVELQATRLTLAGAVVDALVAEDAATREERLLARLVDIDADVLAVVDARHALGDVATSAVWAQKQQLHDRKSALAAAQLQRVQSLDLLASLEGRLPADVVAQAEPLTFALPDIPAQLTGAALLQRPDVRMAGAQLHAADASLEAALASRLPQVTLTADAGYAVGVAGALFNPMNVVWDVGASVTQSLFDAGAKRHQAEAARALVAAQDAQYRATVIAAFKEVADSLEAVRRDADADAEAAERTAAARQQWEIADRGQALGDLSRQDVLALQSQLLQNLALQVETRAARLADAADAFVALGGQVGDGGEGASADCGATPPSP